MLIFSLLFSFTFCIPSQPYYFTNQLVDHFSVNSDVFSQRYYKNDSYYREGGPIFVIMGGEGAIPPSTGLYYPWVAEILASQFGALVIEAEHRFYGESVPVPPYSTQRLQLLTPQQSLADTARFILFIKNEYNVPSAKVVTFGGSYPGWLSAMMRIRYPNIVDFSYSASAPMKFYTQSVNQFEYYKIVTNSAESALNGCSSNVRNMLLNTLGVSNRGSIISNLNLCQPLPAYLQINDVQLLIDEITMIVMYSFANLNMGNYPPPNTPLYRSCLQINNDIKSKMGGYWVALENFLNSYSDLRLERPTLQIKPKRNILKGQCYNMSLQLPSGQYATISSGDWSGVGTGNDGANWDFETSTYLVEAIGVNGISDMFLARNWTLQWLNRHAMQRFSTAPQPTLLSDLWGFGDLKKINANHIIFTNGLKDGWSAGGVMTSIPSQNIFVLNMKNGAHHSDLLHSIINNDTPDVLAARQDATNILESWLLR